jgi:hypothetical protein
MQRGPTSANAKTLLAGAPLSVMAAFLRPTIWLDFTINTAGCCFRNGQPAKPKRKVAVKPRAAKTEKGKTATKNFKSGKRKK